MSYKVRAKGKITTAQPDFHPEYEDVPFELAETTFEGYTFHWGSNEMRNFLDDSVGIGHANFRTSNTDIAFGDTFQTQTPFS